MYAIVYLPMATIVKYTRRPKVDIKYFDAITPTAEGLKVLMSKKYEIIHDGREIVIQPTTGPLKSAYHIPRHLVEIVEI